MRLLRFIGGCYECTKLLVEEIIPRLEEAVFFVQESLGVSQAIQYENFDIADWNSKE